jgi:TBC1 domain family member 15
MEQVKDMLLTYNEYNRDLGYVQGMSDLLAPVYAVLQDDALAFWAFQRFMERMERNFLRDQSGMRSQLLTLDHLTQFMDPKLYAHLQSADSTNFFFFFRMLLVWYKREFEWMDVLRLWETLWTDYLSSSFHLFVALAIMEKHRDVIMVHLKHFDEVLKYGMFSLVDITREVPTDDVTVNELSGTIDLESTLIRAEALFKRFQRLVEAIDKKGNFPAPRLRIGFSSPSSSSQDVSSGSTAKTTATSPSSRTATPPAKGNGKGKEEAVKVITPELRQLLSREVIILPKEGGAKKPEGFPR